MFNGKQSKQKKNLLIIVILREKIILFKVNINLSHIHEWNGGDFGTPGLILIRNASIEWEGSYYPLFPYIPRTRV
jgi:hypothetical protein